MYEYVVYKCYNFVIITMSDRTTILIQHVTRERLKTIGKKGQTYDDVINELIKLQGR